MSEGGDVSIIEAIKRAESEHAVYLLLTAYLESLWVSETRGALRGSLRRLPIEGQTDVQERAQVLASEERAAEGPVIAEAAEIFRVAIERLGLSQVAVPRTSDTPSEESRTGL
jgi:hypothetical protein